MSQVIPTSSPKEVLTKIKIVFRESEIHLHGTDLAQYLTLIAPCETTEPGIALLAYSDLRDIVSRMTGDNVELTLDGKVVGITDSRASFELQVHSDLNEFPGACDWSRVYTTQIDSEQLCQCLESVIHCIDKESTRFALNAVYIEGSKEEGVLRFTATDGRRITWIEVPSECETFTALLPAQSAKAIIEIVDEQISCRLCIGESWVGIEADNMSFLCRRAEGRFPSTKTFREMTKTTFRYSEASLAELKTIANQAAVVSMEDQMGVTLQFTSTEIIATHQSPKAKYRATTPCNHAQAKVTINSIYLQQALSRCKSVAVASDGAALSIMRDGNCFEIIQGFAS